MLTGSSVSPRDRARAQRAAALVSGPVSQLVSRSSRPAAWSMVRSSTSTHGAEGGSCWWPAPVISGHSLRDPAGVGDRERVERLGPALGGAAFDEPARCLAVLAPAGFPGPVAGALVLDVADRQPQQLDDRVIVREVAPVLDDLAQLVVQALDRVRGVDDLPDLGRERQERGEPLPGALPGRDHARVAAAELHQPAPAARSRRRRGSPRYRP